MLEYDEVRAVFKKYKLTVPGDMNKYHEHLKTVEKNAKKYEKFPGELVDALKIAHKKLKKRR